VIHFSCHGLFDPDAPQQSGLLLSSGWLTVQRIIAEMRLERRTRLVTVSACVSGRAEVRRGEEHVGLLQALMSAGARAVVASLWSVDDASTRILFEAFYEKRAAGASPADALADAARLVRALPDREHPYYWAAFQASGLAHLPNNKPKAAHPLTGRATRRIADEPSTNSSTRGGFWAVNEMDMVQRSQHLLEEMSDDPEGVLAELGPVEGQKVVADLSALAEQAEEVQTEAALLELADAIHRLIEDTPALADLLLPEGMEVRKTITPSIHNAAYEKSQYAQEYAARVRNRLVEAHEELEQALRDLLSQGEERRSEGEGRR